MSCSSAKSFAPWTWGTTASSPFHHALESWPHWLSWSSEETVWSVCPWSWESADCWREAVLWSKRTSSTRCPPRLRSSCGKLTKNKHEPVCEKTKRYCALWSGYRVEAHGVPEAQRNRMCSRFSVLPVKLGIKPVPV